MTHEPFVRFFSDRYSWQVISTTVTNAVAVTAVCLAVGYPVAFAIAWSKGWVQIALLDAIIQREKSAGVRLTMCAGVVL